MLWPPQGEKNWPRKQIFTSINVFPIPHFNLNIVMKLSYLPTPPLGQDMTQGQFLSGV